MVHDQHRRAVALGDLAGAGAEGRRARLPLLVDEQIGQGALGRDALGIDGQAGRRLGEFTRLDKARGQVRPGAEDLGPQGLGRRRGQPKVQRQRDQGGARRQPDGRRDDVPAAHAAGKAHHDLVLGVQPVQGDDRGDEDSDWQDQADQLGQGQQGDLQKHSKALTLVDNEVQSAQTLAEKRHHGQCGQGERRRDQQLAKQITFNECHCAAGSPLQPSAGRVIFYTAVTGPDNQSTNRNRDRGKLIKVRRDRRDRLRRVHGNRVRLPRRG